MSMQPRKALWLSRDQQAPSHHARPDYSPCPHTAVRASTSLLHTVVTNVALLTTLLLEWWREWRFKSLVREKSNTRHEHFKWLSRGSKQRGRVPIGHKAVEKNCSHPSGPGAGCSWERGEDRGDNCGASEMGSRAQWNVKNALQATHKESEIGTDFYKRKPGGGGERNWGGRRGIQSVNLIWEHLRNRVEPNQCSEKSQAPVAWGPPILSTSSLA